MKKVLSFMLSMFLLLSMLPTGALLVNAEPLTTKMVGDLDHDGEVTDWDGVLLARRLAGWAVTVADEKILDIDGDGEITDWDGVMFDRHLAGWNVATEVGKHLAFAITYENTKNATNPNPATYKTGVAAIALDPLYAEHYSFAGWYIGNEKVTHIPTDGEGELTIRAHWTPVDYTITYLNTKDAANNNPIVFNIESNEIVLQDLSSPGYTFAGWYNGNTQVTSIPAGTTGNIALTAKWTTCNYSITYENTKDSANNNPTGYTVETGVPTLSELQKDGYTFDGWYLNGAKVTTIPVGTTGDLTLEAKWTPITYTATFTADGSVVTTRYFTIEDTTIANIPNVPTKAGYIGAWSNYTLGAANITIPAVYSLNEYTITYANTKGAENSNPSDYSVITGTFQLADLQCDGYDFAGWYKGSNKITAIEQGTTGNITLTAKWTPITYSITYNDEKNLTHSNPDTYTIESDTITLSPLSADGYIFEGWYNGNKKVTSIPKGSIGDLKLTAKWSIITYTITYRNLKDYTNKNQTTYTVEDQITLLPLNSNVPQQKGYIFEGWYIGNEKIEEIPAGTYGNLTLTAKWTPFVYTFKFTQMYDAENPNTLPETTTVETWPGDYTLLAPTRNGYTFDSWTAYDGSGFTYYDITYISLGRIKSWSRKDGSFYLRAEWTAIEYPIQYVSNIDTEITNTNPVIYTIEDSITLADASCEGFIFKGWYADAEYKTPVTTIEKGSFGEKTLYAKWEFNGTYIDSAEDFANIVYDMSGGYMLSNSITISAPLGDETNPFTGYFCGNGYWIYGSEVFSINKGTISEVNTAKLLCDTNNGTIVNCSSQGGIARINSGTIHRCKSTGYVSYSTKGDYTFRGERYRYDINKKQYYFDSYVTGYSQAYQYVGGLVAYNDSTGVISQCAVAHRTATTYTLNQGSDYISNLFGYVGGFAGYSLGSITDSYYSGTTLKVACTNDSYFQNSNTLSWNSNYTASAHLYCGGFIGYSTGNISGCYANVTSIAGTVDGTGWSASNKHYGRANGYLGGLAGYAKNVSKSFCSVENISYYDIPDEPYLCSYYRYIGTSLGDYYNTNDFTSLYYNSDCSLSTIGIYGRRTIGTATSAANFKSRNFMMNTFGWSEDVWTFTNGSLPKLKWE